MYFYIHIIKCKDEKSNMDRMVLALWGRLGSAGHEYGWPRGGESEPLMDIPTGRSSGGGTD